MSISPMRYFTAYCVMFIFSLPALALADCQHTSAVPGLQHIYSDSWGVEPDNQRFQPALRTSITVTNVGHLKLLWAYGLATRTPRSWPLVTEDTIFIGDSGKGLVALDRTTGCSRWVLKHSGQISSAILYRRDGARVTLYFTDRTQGVFAVNATNGKLLWRKAVKEPALAMYSGTPLIHGNVIYVPISSQEVAIAANPFYGCCTTSGGMAALDATTGKELWYRPTIESPPTITHSHYYFVQNHAPSGAPVWSSPTLNVATGTLYFGTGQNYSKPTSNTSDAIFAVNATNGAIQWVHQFTKGDAYNLACDISLHHPNCPGPRGPDADFGAPPMLLRTPDGKQLLIAGQKSGDIYAMDPASGATVWHRHIGRGGALGGVHWGMAYNPQLGLVFVPISDIEAWSSSKPAAPGLYALDAATGKIRWSHERKARCARRICSAGISAAIAATPELVFSGSLDGYLEAYDAASGKLLWSADTWKDYKAVNPVKTSGGGFDAHGPMVAGNQVIVSSGYELYERGGNALLVYQLEP